MWKKFEAKCLGVDVGEWTVIWLFVNPFFSSWPLSAPGFWIVRSLFALFSLFSVGLFIGSTAIQRAWHREVFFRGLFDAETPVCCWRCCGLDSPSAFPSLFVWKKLKNVGARDSCRLSDWLLPVKKKMFIKEVVVAFFWTVFRLPREEWGSFLLKETPSLNLSKYSFVWNERVIWLILPVAICLSQRLSHACLSTSLIKVKPRMAH